MGPKGQSAKEIDGLEMRIHPALVEAYAVGRRG